MSPTNGNHGASDAFSKHGAVELMLLRLAADSGSYDFDDFVVGGAVSEYGLDIGFFGGKKAGAQLSIGGEPKPVAGWAEVVAYGTDDADDALRFGIAIVGSGSIAIGALGGDKRRDPL